MSGIERNKVMNFGEPGPRPSENGRRIWGGAVLFDPPPRFYRVNPKKGGLFGRSIKWGGMDSRHQGFLVITASFFIQIKHT